MDKIIGAGLGVHILWGIGLLGLLMCLVTNAYLGSLVRASANMATTKKKKLRIMRQKYENGKSLGLHRGKSEAFVEKNVRQLRLLGLPLPWWTSVHKSLACATAMAVAVAYIYYDTSWRNTPDNFFFLANAGFVGAFLMGLGNIFLLNNKMEILKANIRDYLENIPEPRAQNARPLPDISPVYVDDGRKKRTQKHGENEVAAAVEAPCFTEVDVGEKKDRDTGQEDVELLNRFLKEFFA